MAVGVSWAELVLLLFSWGGLFGSGGVAPLPEDPVVAQIAPAECLFYSSWTGRAQSSPDSANATERLFSDPKFLAYVEQVNNHIREAASQGAGARGIEPAHVEAAFRLLDHLHSHAGAFYISEISSIRDVSPSVFGGLALRVDDDDRDLFLEALNSLLKLVPGELQSSVAIDEVKVSRIDFGNGAPPITWAFKENYLIVGIGEGEVKKIVGKIDEHSIPDWLIEAKQAVATPRPASFVHLDIQRLFSTIRETLVQGDDEEFTGALEAFGLDAIESFSYGGGLDNEGAVTRGRMKLSGELHGMLTLLDCEPLAAADFQQISSESPVALVFRLSPADAMTAFLDSCDREHAQSDAGMMAKNVRQGFDAMQRIFGIDIRGDLLGSMGDTWKVFVRPGPNVLSKGALRDGWTLLVDLKDAAKFTKAHDEFLAAVREGLNNVEKGKIISQKNEQAVFHSAHIQGFPLTPSWAIYEDRLLITTSTVSAHLSLTTPAPKKTLAKADHVRPFLEEGRQTLKLVHIDMAAVMEQVPDLLPAGTTINSSLLPPLDVVKPFLRPTVIAVERTEEGVEMTMHSTLPNIDFGQAVPLLVGVTLPAVQGARGAAQRAQSINNQKQIGLAMHNFHDVNGVFPAGYSADEDGKPLLSWRVHILPYIEGQALYNQFHLDEPWDSLHNKKLIEQMPDVFRSPRSSAEPGKTTYLGVSGADGVFVRPQDGNNLGIGLRNITDGTSLTVLSVETTDKRAIVWTRPGDFAPNKKDPQKGLRVDLQRGMSFGFVDGSVRSIPKSVAKETLNAYFTKSGGEVVKRP